MFHLFYFLTFSLSHFLTFLLFYLFTFLLLQECFLDYGVCYYHTAYNLASGGYYPMFLALAPLAVREEHRYDKPNQKADDYL